MVFVSVIFTTALVVVDYLSFLWFNILKKKQYKYIYFCIYVENSIREVRVPRTGGTVRIGSLDPYKKFLGGNEAIRVQIW